MLRHIRTHLSGQHGALLLCFFFGHAVFHFMGQSFSVLLPAIQKTFAITPVQIGALIATREIVSGIISLPGGILSDYLSTYRAHILAICLIIFSFGWLVIAIAPYYAMLFVGIVCIAVASSVWHLPALVELGKSFPDRRGTVFAIHGAGGSSGDIIGPMATGLLLAFLGWREIVSVYIVLPLVATLWTFLLYRRIARQPEATPPSREDAQERSAIGDQLRTSLTVLKNTDIWRINLVAGLRSMCFAVLITFLPLYMHDSGFSPASTGFHFGLLWAIGLFASPLMGYASDRVGRKVVLVPALFYSGLMTAALAWCGTGNGFTVVIILLGLSVRSDYSLINATIMDMVKSRVETTMLGVLSVSRHIMGATAPLIAGLLYQYLGMTTPFIFAGILFVLAAVIFASADISGPRERHHLPA